MTSFRPALLMILIGLLTHAQPQRAYSADLNIFEPKPLDGVPIEAVEDYPGQHKNQVGLGLGLYPFNAYYLGLIVNANYIQHLKRNLAWEILNVSYAYSIQNSLTTELADRFAVNPIEIKRLDFLVSSNAHFGLLDGKFVLLEENIRYFKTSGILGLGLAKTNQDASFTANFGFLVEIFTGDKISWRIDVRDQLAISGFTNYITVTIGMMMGL